MNVPMYKPAAKVGLSFTMNRMMLILLLCLAVPALLPAQDPLSAQYMPTIDTNCADYPSNVWVTDTMQKIQQRAGGPPGCSSGQKAWGTFYGTQGEFVDFQVHVQAPSGGYSALTISASGFTQPSPGSFTIPAPSSSATDVLVYREAYMNVTIKSSTASTYYNATGYYPDILIPTIDPYWHQTTNAWPVSVAANQNQSAWVDVLIPQSAPAGYYKGTITVSNSGSTIATLPIVLAIWQWPSAGYMPSQATLPIIVETWG